MPEATDLPETPRNEPLVHIVDILADRMQDPLEFAELPRSATLNEVDAKYDSMKYYLSTFSNSLPKNGVRSRFADNLLGVLDQLQKEAQKKSIKSTINNEVSGKQTTDTKPKEKEEKEEVPEPVLLMGTLMLRDVYDLAGREMFAPSKTVVPRLELLKRNLELKFLNEDKKSTRAVFAEHVWSYMSELGRLSHFQDVWVTEADKQRVISEQNPDKRSKIYNQVVAKAEHMVPAMFRKDEMAA